MRENSSKSGMFLADAPSPAFMLLASACVVSSAGALAKLRFAGKAAGKRERLLVYGLAGFLVFLALFLLSMPMSQGATSTELKCAACERDQHPDSLPVTIDYVGEYYPPEEITVESQEYIDKYFKWEFEKMNRTHWLASFTIGRAFWGDVKGAMPYACSDPRWIKLKNRYLPEYDVTTACSDLKNLTGYPLRALSEGMKFSGLKIDMDEGKGSFYIIFEKGFSGKMMAEFGFGSTLINTFDPYLYGETPKLDLEDKYNASQAIKQTYKLKGFLLEMRTGENSVGIKVGDVTQFNPNLEISKWGEVNFKLKPDLSDVASKDKSFIFDGDKIKFDLPEEQFILYGKNDSYEYDIILKSKPKNNTQTMQIETTNLDYFYQPPLTVEYQNGYSEEFQRKIVVSETEVRGLDGFLLVERPENVVGSYAVYYKDGKAGDYSLRGGKNYRVGKVFHIYRPQIIDSAGTKVWGELNIANGKLTITIPQDFLDKAVYPVIIDPTLGYTNLGGSAVYRAANAMFGYQGTTDANGGNVNETKIGGYSLAADKSVKGVVTNSSYIIIQNGISDVGTLPGSKDWTTVVYSTQPSLSADTTYAVWAIAASAWYVAGDYGGSQLGQDTTNSYSTPTDPTDWASSSYKWSVYATYTAGGDTTSPTYSLNSTNSTTAGSNVLHSLYWQDGTGLSGCRFSFDNCTGTLVNDSWIPINGSGNWSNFTKSVNTTVGCTIRWAVTCNDTANNWNYTLWASPFSYNTTSGGGQSGFACSIMSSCGGGNTTVLYLQNDTGGYRNAHAQNVSVGTYAYSICCSSTATLSYACSQGVFLKLNATTNTHVQKGDYSGPGIVYGYNVCLTATPGYFSCTYVDDSCPAERTCFASMASALASENNDTDAHIGPCDEYRRKICCNAATGPIVAYVSPTPGDNSRQTANSVIINVTVGVDSGTIDTCLLEWRNGTNPAANETMQKIGTGGNVTCNITKPTTDATNYTFRVYANDSSGVMGSENSRQFRENDEPAKVVLTSPANQSHNTSRTPTFQWNVPSDADGDTLNYTINISCFRAGDPCPSDDNIVTDIATNSYTPTTELKYFGDDNYYYNWSVRAGDGYEFGQWSDVWKLTIDTNVSIILLNDTVDFGENRLPGYKDNTTDNSPYPLSLRNIGNCMVNVNISSQDLLWDSASQPSDYFNYSVNWLTGEGGAFNWGGSQTSSVNVPQVYQNVTFIDYLNYTSGNSSAEVDIYIEVPPSEPSGGKSSILVFAGEYHG